MPNMLRFFLIKIIIPVTMAVTLIGCTRKPGNNFTPSENLPAIEPDYTGIVIPPNIAPMNFIIKEKGETFFARLYVDDEQEIEIRSGNGLIRINQRKWNDLVSSNRGKDLKIDIFIKNNGVWKKFRTITNTIANEPVDPYLTYRVIYPGYESWSELSIMQRSLESFRTSTIIKNSVADDNCVNCHSYNNGKSDDFMFHMRGSLSGTYFYTAGKMSKRNLKTGEMKNGSVYPRWHPSGKYVAFSSNNIVQRFHSSESKKIEVSDLESSLVLYDLEKNQIMPVPVPGSSENMDTYPEWSPDGRILYFCRAPQIAEVYDYRQIRYNLWKITFDPDLRQFGKAELVYNADSLKKSISFPRISPDGRSVIVTISNYGCFPIWHNEADLYSIDATTGKASSLSLNSEFTDSYHSWSSNGRWIVFSSRRGDGLTTRPWLAHIDPQGMSGKPFIIPQRNPDVYNTNLKSFNLPELSVTRIKMKPGTIRRISKQPAEPAGWSEK